MMRGASQEYEEEALIDEKSFCLDDDFARKRTEVAYVVQHYTDIGSSNVPSISWLLPMKDTKRYIDEVITNSFNVPSLHAVTP